MLRLKTCLLVDFPSGTRGPDPSASPPRPLVPGRWDVVLPVPSGLRLRRLLLAALLPDLAPAGRTGALRVCTGAAGSRTTPAAPEPPPSEVARCPAACGAAAAVPPSVEAVVAALGGPAAASDLRAVAHKLQEAYQCLSIAARAPSRSQGLPAAQTPTSSASSQPSSAPAPAVQRRPGQAARQNLSKPVHPGGNSTKLRATDVVAAVAAHQPPHKGPRAGAHLGDSGELSGSSRPTFKCCQCSEAFSGASDTVVGSTARRVSSRR